MDFKMLKQQYESKTAGIPEEFADRKKVECKDVKGVFTNDEPAVILRKPKNEKNKDTKKWERSYSKDKSKALFQDVLYMPIEYKGEKCILVTAVPEIVRVVACLVEDMKQGALVKGESYEDINRVERFEAEEVIEGTLVFGSTERTYANGETYDVPVLESAE